MSISSAPQISRWLVATIPLLGISLCSQHSHAVTRDAASPADLVKEALHREIYGLDKERQKLLSDAAGRDANYGPAQWHRGFIQSGGQWLDVDAVVRDAQSDLIIEYAANREKSPDTVEGHLQLANWCREKQLPMQERAHLSRILELNGDHAGARERLGFRRVAGRWLTETEIADTLGRRRLESDAARRWRPELVEIGRDLHHSMLARQEAARARLSAIKDVHSIPTMESVLSVTSEEGALAVVEAVGKIKGKEAVESLVRHAVFSNWPLVRQAAADRLKERKWASFVPMMLREMYMPLVSRFDITETRDGRILYTHSFAREGQEEEQVLRIDTAFTRVSRPDGDAEDSLMRAFRSSFSGLTRREAEAVRQNSLQMTYNQRLVEALRIATYQDIPNDPKLWWQWWDKQNDIARLGGKQTRAQYQIDQVAIIDRGQTAMPRGRPGRSARIDSNGNLVASPECFAAGTKVWTRYGEQNIESIQIGDLVLAQNVESGELTFKPVLGRTIRPAEDLVKVRVGKDTFECSRGHLFWVSGHGWAKAERLESGVSLHCLRGASPLSSVDTGLKAETYNLIVADFHTYFVGHERVLSHDVTQMNPTEVVVPGLRDD